MNLSYRNLFFFLEPKALILSFSIFNIFWMDWRDSQVNWHFLNYHGYYADTHRALILVNASFGLLFVRWWTRLIAAVLSGWVLYVLIFRALLGISNAHDVPMFSQFAFRNWWLSMYEAQPQYIIHIALAVVIFVYAASYLIWLVYRRFIPNGI